MSQVRATVELLAINRDLLLLWTSILAVDWVASWIVGILSNSSTWLLPVLVFATVMLMESGESLSQW